MSVFINTEKSRLLHRSKENLFYFPRIFSINSCEFKYERLISSDGSICLGLGKIGGIRIDDLQMIDDNPSENSAPTATPPSSYRASIKLNCDDDELSSCKYDISRHTDKESSPRLDLTLDIKEDFPGVNPTPSYLHIHGPSLFQCTHGCFNDKKN